MRVVAFAVVAVVATVFALRTRRWLLKLRRHEDGREIVDFRLVVRHRGDDWSVVVLVEVITSLYESFMQLLDVDSARVLLNLTALVCLTVLIVLTLLFGGVNKLCLDFLLNLGDLVLNVLANAVAQLLVSRGVYRLFLWLLWFLWFLWCGGIDGVVKRRFWLLCGLLGGLLNRALRGLLGRLLA